MAYYAAPNGYRALYMHVLEAELVTAILKHYRVPETGISLVLSQTPDNVKDSDHCRVLVPLALVPAIKAILDTRHATKTNRRIAEPRRSRRREFGGRETYGRHGIVYGASPQP